VVQDLAFHIWQSSVPPLAIYSGSWLSNAPRALHIVSGASQQ
jgi:hypothetical protein